SDNAIYEIIEKYTAEAGVRNLERSIVTICRKIAREIVSNEEPPKRVISRNLEKYLGVPKIYPSEIEKKNMIGIATGLAWTPYGGDIILVEATLFPGDGKITLTGQLGDVMQESAKASLSYIRSRAEKLKIDNKKFKDFDLHLHIPAGAIPKDGPSAGITMATAMASIFQNRSVKHDVGMTGEITLRGRVLLCPLISASSLIPPNDILINFLFNALAIDWPNEVFPVPGGPIKQRIVPLAFPLSFLTAK
ncbi:unnamed protein product, partial [marine sediment metagenome]